jgi:hypothetical protein
MSLLKTFIMTISCMVIVSVYASGVQAGTIYEYVDRDGSVILTDSPPPGVKARPVQKFLDISDAEKQEMDKEKSLQTQKFRESDVKRREKEGKIRAARAEYEQALKDEQRYRANKNQARGYAQQRHWINMIEEQGKEIEEKKKKLTEIESEP